MFGNLLGGPAQGILTIYDYTVLEDKEKGEPADFGKSSPATSANVKYSAAMSPSASLSVAGLSDGSIKAESDSYCRKKRVYVQFNPEVIRINAQGGGSGQITDFSSKDKNGGLKYGELSPHIYVTIPLIFDRENNAIAFSEDKLGTLSSASGLVKNIASLAMSNSYTVQPQVEGFLAAVRGIETRRVSFSWSDIYYYGLLNEVDATYTMFDPDGVPIRAKVNLRIVCADASIEDGYGGQWQDKYNKAFSTSSLTSGTNYKSAVGSALNLG